MHPNKKVSMKMYVLQARVKRLVCKCCKRKKNIVNYVISLYLIAKCTMVYANKEIYFKTLSLLHYSTKEIIRNVIQPDVKKWCRQMIDKSLWVVCRLLNNMYILSM